MQKTIENIYLYQKYKLFLLDSSKYKTSILNDGKNILADDIDVYCINSTTALVTLYREDQSHEKIRVVFDKYITYEVL